MRFHTWHPMRGLLAAIPLVLLASQAVAQDLVIVRCTSAGQCAFQRIYGLTLQGKDSVRKIPPSASADAEAIRKAPTFKLGSLPSLYRDPKSELVRETASNGAPGDIVLPSKLPPRASSARAAMAGAVFECQTLAKGQGRLSVPANEFVALLVGRQESSVIEFLKREMTASDPHPAQAQLVAAGLAFAKDSQELRSWRDQLKTTMRDSLERFRTGGGDPSQLESVLFEGRAAMRAYRIVTPDARDGDDPQKDLVEEHRRFVERTTIAFAFKNAGLYDAYLDEIDQLGLAWWSRPELVAGVQEALKASVDSHYRAAEEAMNAKQFAQAFDEASLASKRSPCDLRVARLFNNARVQYVHASAVPAASDYSGPNRNELDQIVLTLQAMQPEDRATREGREDAKRRIREGEEMDAHYLPLLFEKAQFLDRIKEYSAARDVVTTVERNVPLADKQKWLALDGSIDLHLSNMRQRSEAQAIDLIRRGEFSEAFKLASDSLVSDPDNPTLLYAAAVAAAVQRDAASARRNADAYLRKPVLGCGDSPEIVRNLRSLYHASGLVETPSVGDGKSPNWMSGAMYLPGEVYYDPLSGSFQPHVTGSLLEEKTRNVKTSFAWTGYNAVRSITTEEGGGREQAVRQVPTNTTVQPVYDQRGVYMKAVATESGGGAPKTFPLTYLNAPDFDPKLAEVFTGKLTTRGWTGNPFFHPFLWEGVYLFDLEYDDLGRIKRATPVLEGVARPSSQFLEPLVFTWEGATKRLKSIDGARYHREMKYDVNGRLIREDISYQAAKGYIEYRYDGMSRQPSLATCEDFFYDRGRRTVTFAQQPQR